MATRYFGIAATDGVQVVGSDVIGAASGGTLAGSQNVQVVFDDAVYTSSREGKQRLVAALTLILSRLENTREWPISTVS